MVVVVLAAVLVQGDRQRQNAEEQRITFAAVGDSVTAANSADIDAGKSGNGSWTYYAASGRVRFVGGWALGGATTADMLQNVQPVRADVLVVLAGTNDSGDDVPFATSAANIKAIVRKVRISHVVVSAIPPRDEDPSIATEFNSRMRSYAASQGWTFVDSMTTIRTSSATYRKGYTSDGIHPTVAGAREIGAAIRAAIVSVES